MTKDPGLAPPRAGSALRPLKDRLDTRTDYGAIIQRMESYLTIYYSSMSLHQDRQKKKFIRTLN